MKNKILLLCFLLTASLHSWARGLSDEVNPFIGTGGHGHVFIGANVPFGFVQLGPTQSTQGWDWCSGYHYSDSLLLGFSHLHLSGTGVGDLGDITFLPVKSQTQQKVHFSHARENASPGYYSILLEDPDVLVELSATKRTGIQRYTFSDNTPVMLRLDLNIGIGWDKVLEASAHQEGRRVLTGRRISHGWADYQQLYFVAEFSEDVTIKEQESGVWLLSTPTSAQPLMVKVGLSAVSVENARQNLAAEMPGWDFENVREQARNEWNRELGRIEVQGGTATQRTIFYTALYHTMTAPSVFNDMNGDYRGSDRQVHQGDFTNYTTFSLWDTYRALHPLMTLIHQEKMADIARTMLHIYAEQGKLPVWHLMGNETNCMVGNPAIPVLADMILKDLITDRALIDSLYNAMKASAMLDERQLDLLKQYGYLPFDCGANETVGKGMEYAIADDALSRVATRLGKTEDAAYFHRRGQSYHYYFDPKSHFMRAISKTGRYREPFNPFEVMHDYTEGNGWQYTFLVPHDPQGLIRLFDSRSAFVAKLDSLFIAEGELGADAPPDVSGLIGQYAHGNEPSHHVIYLYNYAYEPWKAADLLRRTMQEMYRNEPDGLSGNEDVGQMSAWYILSAAGIYQVEPAGGPFAIGSPIFNKVVFHLGNGKTFTVTARHNSEQNKYVSRAFLNGQPLRGMFIDSKSVVNGGELVLEMSNDYRLAPGPGTIVTRTAREITDNRKRSKAQIVDVRTPKEYDDGHLRRAHNIDVLAPGFGAKALRALNKDKPVVVYCRSGKRSLRAAEELARLGFGVINMKGGWLEYQETVLKQSRQ